jgi:hypothetical protein
MPFVKGQPGGPGRRRKADKFARPIARAEKQIADRLPELIDNMLALASGDPPDRQANEYLINRILGKPTERQEIGGLNGGPIVIEAYDYTIAIAAIAAGSGEDSDPSGEDASTGDGPAMG